MHSMWFLCALRAHNKKVINNDDLENQMAEEEGFEPPRLLHPFGFQDRPLQPDLGIPP